MNTITVEIKQDNSPYRKGQEVKIHIQLITRDSRVAIFKANSISENPNYKIFDNVEKLEEFLEIKKILFPNGNIISSPSAIKSHLIKRLEFRNQSIEYSSSSPVIN